MTKALKPVRRETFSSVRERGKLRPLIIEVASTYVRMHPKGMRGAYTVTMDQIWNLGAANAAAERRRERIAARKRKDTRL